MLGILLALFPLVAGAASTNSPLSFTWDQAQPSQGVVRVNLYEEVGTNRVLLATVTNSVLGQMPTNFLTISNWTFTTGVSRKVLATFVDNLSRESTASVPCWVNGSAPDAPVVLRPLPLSMVVPVPGEVEISSDLVDWRRRIILKPASDGVMLAFVTYPTEPMMLMRSVTLAESVAPLVP